MLDYMINLYFLWASAKSSHAVLCIMEHGEIAGWSDTKKIDGVRRAHAQRHTLQNGG